MDLLVAQRAKAVTFVDRSRRVNDGFSPSATNKPAVQDQISDTARLMHENIEKRSPKEVEDLMSSKTSPDTEAAPPRASGKAQLASGRNKDG